MPRKPFLGVSSLDLGRFTLVHRPLFFLGAGQALFGGQPQRRQKLIDLGQKLTDDGRQALPQRLET